MGMLSKMGDRANRLLTCRSAAITTGLARIAKSTRGQGTTEYAILVGVLVVIAILAIMVFRPRLQELWDAIADGIQGL